MIAVGHGVPRRPIVAPGGSGRRPRGISAWRARCRGGRTRGPRAGCRRGSRRCASVSSAARRRAPWHRDRAAACSGLKRWPRARIVGAVDAIAVERAGPRVRQVAVPDLVGVFRQHDAVDLALARGVEQAELDLFGVRREQREVDALAVPGGAERIGLPGQPATGRRWRQRARTACRAATLVDNALRCQVPRSDRRISRSARGSRCRAAAASDADRMRPAVPRHCGSASTPPALPTLLPP